MRSILLKVEIKELCLTKFYIFKQKYQNVPRQNASNNQVLFINRTSLATAKPNYTMNMHFTLNRK